jgi:hypothetical protein
VSSGRRYISTIIIRQIINFTQPIAALDLDSPDLYKYINMALNGQKNVFPGIK